MLSVQAAELEIQYSELQTTAAVLADQRDELGRAQEFSAALVRSIRRKLLPLGDDIGFICGHGPASSFGEERKQNPFLQFAP